LNRLASLSQLPPPRFRFPRPALSSLLNSKANLSGDMALRIEKAFGVKMDTLAELFCYSQRFCRDGGCAERRSGSIRPKHFCSGRTSS
jgi:hypothetical protein